VLSPAVLGTACCIASALGYTAANACMRQLASLGADTMWAVCVKEVVTVAVVGPWLALMAFRGMGSRFPLRWVALLVLVGLVTQLGGNLSFQWGLGVVGLAVSMAAMFGVMLTGSAAMGRVFLGERVSRRSIAAIALLLASVGLLSVGVAVTGKWIPGTPGPWTMALGVGAGCLAGAAYALLTITIRTTASARLPITTIVFIITGMGVLSLGGLSVWRLGAGQLLKTPPGHLAWMLAAGTFNLLAFLAITKGLQLTTVVHANVLNGSQIAMGAVVGMLCFKESSNPWLLAGICLTIVGVVLIGQPQADEPDVPGA